MKTLKLKSKIVIVCIIMFCVASVSFFLGLNGMLSAHADTYDEPTIICKATLEDDFADNKIIIVMSVEETNRFKSYLPTDFPELSIEKVEELSLPTKNLIKQRRSLNSPFKVNSKVNSQFRTILCLTLTEHDKQNVLDGIEVLLNRDEIICAEPDYILETNYEPNDTRYVSGEMWGLNGVNGIDAPLAWNIVTGSTKVKVGIIDSGIDSTHEDLRNRVNRSLSRDFSNLGSESTGALSDTHGHGSHVAGTIGAQSNNTIGVAGINFDADLVSLKICEDGHTTSFASKLIEAVNYANSVGIRVLNNSNGYSNSADPSISLDYAIMSYDGLFVNSAGNNNRDLEVYNTVPCSDNLSNVLVVGATAKTGKRWGSSNYNAKKVHIYAPGESILSTVPTSKYSSGYALYSGTSMAAPHVAGTAAMLLSIDPTLTGEELKSIITSSADIITIDKGLVKKLNLFKSVSYLLKNTTQDLFSLTNLSDTEVQIDGLKSDYQGKLEIPTLINGKKVTKIKEEAFQGQKGITAVILPNTITDIGNAAFMNCWKLESISFGSGSNLKNINGYAFQQCFRLKSITIPYSVTNVSYGILSFAEQATIYTDAKSAPASWDKYWNKAGWISIERPVVWGCTLSSDKSYVVSFTKNTNSITKSNAINGISAPSREGYTFGGWYNNSNYTGTPISAENINSAANNTTYYAQWVPCHNVFFDFNDDAYNFEVSTVENGTIVQKPNNYPMKSGYVFKYWAESSNLNREYNWNNAVLEDIVIEAVWEPIGSNKVVTFDLNGGIGTFNPQKLVSNGTTVSRPTSPKRVGYTFSHWALSGQSTSYDFSTPVTTNITLTAIWTSTTTYTVTFDTDGSYESYPTVKVNSWDSVKKPDINPVKDGCIFKYWALSSNLNQEYNWNSGVSKDITLKAVWEDMHCYVSFDGVDLSSFPLFSLALLKGDNVQDFLDFNGFQNPTKEGYTFRYWVLSTNKSSAYNLSTAVTKSIRLEAIWDINKYTVSFNTNGGSGSYPNKTIEYGAKVSIPSNPTRSGYIFKHWALAGQTTAYDFNTPVTSNISLVAIWEEEPSCVAKGTMITLADGSQKAVEALTGDEMLLVWNLYTGQFDSAPILFIDKDPIRTYKVINASFSDNTVLKIISEHGLWDYNLNRYVYLDENASQYIGHWFSKQSVDDYGDMTTVRVQLMDVTIQEEQTMAYSPITYGHMCYYVNGMLSMPGGINGLFNIFDVDGATMKYDTDSMESDIAEYGLYTYEELAEILPVTEEMFNAVSGQYLKVAIGKGLLTIEDLQKLIDRYSVFFE